MADNHSSTIVSNTVNRGGNEFIVEMEQMLNELGTLPKFEHCIYRVPTEIRKVKEEAYTPRIVSIGPFHHNNQNLKSMEQLKKGYMNKLVGRDGNSTLKECTDFVTKKEAEIRECYSECFAMESKEFRKMVLVDSCFIIQLFIYVCSDWTDFDFSLYINHMKMNSVNLDLMLLENQVPFFVLEGLCRLATNETFSILDLALGFLKEATNIHLFEGLDDITTSALGSQSIMHFTHLILILHRPPFEVRERRYSKTVRSFHSSTKLTEAGVTFRKKMTNKGLFDVTFSDGVLEIPRFMLTNHTEIQIRNLMALELLLYKHEGHITDYFLLMDCLINTTKDVELFVDEEIIINHLGNNNEVADFINKVCIVPSYSYGFHFSHICENLNNYYKGPKAKVKRKYIHTLKRDYCHTPWKTTATVAAIMLLVFTLIQTVFSIMSHVRDK
ncbi:hypothetical protein LguiA_033066 [Lonicera macranthoides]